MPITCVACEEDDFNPVCGGTTRALTVETCECTVFSENESVKVGCKPMLVGIPKFNFKICGCPTKTVIFKIKSLPSSANGVLMINDTVVADEQEISEQYNGLLFFKRTKMTEFTDTFTFQVIAECGSSDVYTVSINAVCVCEEEDECDECQTCG